jgi:hypothetical protein
MPSELRRRIKATADTSVLVATVALMADFFMRGRMAGMNQQLHHFGMMMRHVSLFAFASVVMLLSHPARSAMVTILASKDNSIFESDSNASAGGAPGIHSGTNGMGSRRRGLIAFNVADVVPAGSVITSAQLTMYLGNTSTANAATIGLHKITKDWGEGTAGSLSVLISGGGGGFAADPGDATWSHAKLGSIAWTNPGATGDFNAAATASSIVTGPIDTAFTWQSSAALVSDVQGWLNSPATNYGWALVNADEPTNRSLKAFYSRSATVDSVDSGPLDPSWRPSLLINFESIGDFNSDGKVDAGDYVIWRKINVGDYATWRLNFGRSVIASGAAAVVPEPAAVVLLINYVTAMSLLRLR